MTEVRQLGAWADDNEVEPLSGPFSFDYVDDSPRKLWPSVANNDKWRLSSNPPWITGHPPPANSTVQKWPSPYQEGVPKKSKHVSVSFKWPGRNSSVSPLPPGHTVLILLFGLRISDLFSPFSSTRAICSFSLHFKVSSSPSSSGYSNRVLRGHSSRGQPVYRLLFGTD